ncbi:ABC-type multidrug transport system, ATPase component [Halovivax ruber XH-70]|uniref:ABC-type multidrug transport system, ATPase component n=1 Tax=Halovivax ruber (strain DSM 18193 / JCM 13892 / XH-70) TaxID=797302 RepID=L0IBD7_HALRX|nr:ABC transporter ATP-binding protein [Halovivax ruber]AGB15556.1 ABC-type multidrug transport system, ATPase component [Halovivax ruber XH-70]
MTAIRTDGLTKRFGDLTAVSGLDLEIEEGEVFGFLGPNGAGKSTTINMLLDFTRPTAGSATVLGYDAQAASDEISQRVGILPEGFSVYDRLTGRKHIEFAIETKGADQSPDDLLARVGLSPEDGDRAAGGYSKGMRQRLATGMALAGDPDLLIMDEPSTGLDPTGINEMQDLVRAEAERGTTVFFSSHILEHVEAVCDRVGILRAGELIALDTIEGLRASVGGGATMTVTAANTLDGVVDAVAAIDGVSNVTATGHRLEAFVERPAAKPLVVTTVADAGVELTDLRIEETSLESMFTTLIEGDDAPATTLAGDVESAPDRRVANAGGDE